MLINKKIDEGTIISVKLSSGDEIVGKLVSIDTDGITVAKPIAVGMAQQGIAFMPFMFGMDEDANVSFKNHHVVTYVTSQEQIKNAYIQNTTGIAAPDGKSGLV